MSLHQYLHLNLQLFYLTGFCSFQNSKTQRFSQQGSSHLKNKHAGETMRQQKIEHAGLQLHLLILGIVIPAEKQSGKTGK